MSVEYDNTMKQLKMRMSGDEKYSETDDDKERVRSECSVCPIFPLIPRMFCSHTSRPFPWYNVRVCWQHLAVCVHPRSS